MMRMGRIRARAEPLVLLRRLRARARDAPARTTLTARWSLAEIAARRPEALHRLDLQCIEGHVYVHVRFYGQFLKRKDNSQVNSRVSYCCPLAPLREASCWSWSELPLFLAAARPPLRRRRASDSESRTPRSTARPPVLQQCSRLRPEAPSLRAPAAGAPPSWPCGWLSGAPRRDPVWHCQALAYACDSPCDSCAPW